jgi:hypothetical protein
MITFYVDVGDDGITTMIMHIDDEFYYTLANYLKFDLCARTTPHGYISGTELKQRILDLPHEWLLQLPEKVQHIGGKKIVTQSKFSEQYIRELKNDMLRMAKIAIDKKALIRWE